MPFKTTDVAPPSPIDGPLSTTDYERRQADIAKALLQSELLWQAHSLELAQRREVIASQVVELFPMTQVPEVTIRNSVA